VLRSLIVRKIWPVIMFLCFGIFDAISTYYVYRQTGTFDYELGLLTNVLYDMGDFAAVIIFKLMFTAIAAILLYFIALNIPRLDRFCLLTCLGASVVGILASLSNMTGAMTGSTLWIFGVRGDFIAYTVFTLFFIAGVIDVIMRHDGYHSVKKKDDQHQ
jgi:hypothetical protein